MGKKKEKKVVNKADFFFVFTFSTIFLRDFGIDYEVRLLLKITFAFLYAGIGVWLGYISRHSLSDLKGMLNSGSNPA